MVTITELSLLLLQTTQALYDKIQTGELESIEELQRQRTKLVSELENVSLQEWPNDVKAECRVLVEKTRQLEKEIIKAMTDKRDAIGREHDQLQRNQQASKAYGNFS